MAIDKKKVTARLPRGNTYTGVLCGYTFDRGVAEGVLMSDVTRFHWEAVEDAKEAPEKPKEPVEITLENLDEVDYPALKSFYFDHKDDEGFPKVDNQRQETLREAIGTFLIGELEPEDPEGNPGDPEDND